MDECKAPIPSTNVFTNYCSELAETLNKIHKILKSQQQKAVVDLIGRMDSAEQEIEQMTSQISEYLAKNKQWFSLRENTLTF